jgi:hypothetical protein
MEILIVMAIAPAHSVCGLVLCTILFANTQLAQMADLLAIRPSLNRNQQDGQTG